MLKNTMKTTKQASRILVSTMLGFTFMLFFAFSASAKGMSGEDFLNLVADQKDKRVVVVNFYASWCPPCREEIPHLIDVQKKFSKDELLVIGVNLDQSEATMHSFNKKAGINHMTIHDNGELQRLFRVSSIPFNLVYGKNGKAIYAQPGLINEAKLTKTIEYGLK